MEYRSFGRTGLRVSAIGYGCMTFGDPTLGNMDQAGVNDMVRARTHGTPSSLKIPPNGLPLCLTLEARRPLRRTRYNTAKPAAQNTTAK